MINLDHSTNGMSRSLAQAEMVITVAQMFVSPSILHL